MPIRLAENFRAVFYAPFYAMLALGLFAEEGVEIELVVSATPGDGVAGLLDGSVDLTWAGPMRVLKARDLDPTSPLLCFGEVVGRDPFYLVARAGLAARGFELADVAKLWFAAVAEVPTPWLCLQHDLREHGLDPDRLPRAPDQPMAANVAALRDGQLDVAQLFEPFVSAAVQDGGEVVHAAASRGPTTYTTFIATRAGIARHGEAFAGIARALVRMQDWIAGHDAIDLADVVALYYPEIAGDRLARALQRCLADGIWSRTPQVSRQGFDRLSASLLSGGFISALSRYEDCVAELA